MSVLGKYTWPSDFIEGVPLESAIPAEGKVFRFVDTIPPRESDFLQHNQEKPTYDYPNHHTKVLGYGVSTWSKISKLKKVKEKYPAPEQYGNKLIASGNLVADLGVIHKSKSGHVTLWKQVNAKPHLFITNKEE